MSQRGGRGSSPGEGASHLRPSFSSGRVSGSRKRSGRFTRAVFQHPPALLEMNPVQRSGAGSEDGCDNRDGLLSLPRHGYLALGRRSVEPGWGISATGFLLRVPCGVEGHAIGGTMLVPAAYHRWSCETARRLTDV